jgi:hypothetical protein
MWESVLLGCALMSPRSWGDSVHLAWRIEELGLEEILPAAPFAPTLFQRHDLLSAPYGRGSEADKSRSFIRSLWSRLGNGQVLSKRTRNRRNRYFSLQLIGAFRR